MTDTLKPGWTWVKFGDVVRLSKDRVADPAAEGIERYVGIEHIEPKDLRIRSWGLVAGGTTFTSYFQPGQVLFVKRRAYQRKVAVADFSGVCSGDIYVLEPKDDRLLPELLPFICQTERFFEHAVGTSAGSLSPRTNWTQLAQYEFALPPLTEQRRMAHLLHVADAAIEAKLTLQSSQHILRSSIREKVYFSTDTKKIKLKDISDIRYGLGQPPPKSDNGIPVIRATNISRGEISGKDILLVNQEDLPQNRAIFLKEGDIILVRSGAYTGDSALVTKKWENAVAGYDLVISPDRKWIHPIYLAEFLLHVRTVKTILVPMSIRTAQPHLNAKQAGSIEIALPYVETQFKDVRIFENLNKSILGLRENIELHKRVKQMLINRFLFENRV